MHKGVFMWLQQQEKEQTCSSFAKNHVIHTLPVYAGLGSSGISFALTPQIPVLDSESCCNVLHFKLKAMGGGQDPHNPL